MTKYYQTEKAILRLQATTETFRDNSLNRDYRIGDRGTHTDSANHSGIISLLLNFFTHLNIPFYAKPLRFFTPQIRVGISPHMVTNCELPKIEPIQLNPLSKLKIRHVIQFSAIVFSFCVIQDIVG